MITAIPQCELMTYHTLRMYEVIPVHIAEVQKYIERCNTSQCISVSRGVRLDNMLMLSI